MHKVCRQVAQSVQSLCTSCAEPLHKVCMTVAQIYVAIVNKQPFFNYTKSGLSLDLKANKGTVIETMGSVHQSFGRWTEIDAERIVLDEML